MSSKDFVPMPHHAWTQPCMDDEEEELRTSGVRPGAPSHSFFPRFRLPLDE